MVFGRLKVGSWQSGVRSHPLHRMGVEKRKLWPERLSEWPQGHTAGSGGDSDLRTAAPQPAVPASSQETGVSEKQAFLKAEQLCGAQEQRQRGSPDLNADLPVGGRASLPGAGFG